MLALLAGGCASQGRSDRMASLESARLAGAGGAQLRFLFEDFGGLSLATLKRTALPYKAVVTAFLRDEERRSGRRPAREEFPRLLSRYGFFVPERIGNWAGEDSAPALDRPLGMVSGTVESRLPPLRVEAVNLGCAGCHAGRTWDAEGLPTREAWLGLPNTSLDLEAYSRDLFAALRQELWDPAAFQREIERTFPEMGRRERRTLRQILRRARLRVAELDRSIGGPTPFSNGGPGRTNGVAALKLRLGLLAADRRYPAEHGFTSIPDLGARVLRSSLLYDGLYAPKGGEHFAPRQRAGDAAEQGRRLASIVAFFTVSTMSVSPKVAEAAIPRMEKVLEWLRDYRPPPFPGRVDRGLARAGQVLYRERCTRCHGGYDESLERPELTSFPNLPVAQEEMGTEPARWQVADERLAAALRRSAFGRHVSIRPGHGYVAPPLSGLWATAPYLHNGSVPTLWQLMNPELRPLRFTVGGHRLDYEQMGIAGRMTPGGDYLYPEGYVPWSTPELYDTRAPGLSNRGHEAEFTGLDAGRKRALLEYLKLL
jgi:hypothetical protein